MSFVAICLIFFALTTNLINLQAVTYDDLTIQYYGKVIEKGQREAEYYQPPTSAHKEFQPLSDTIYDYGKFDYIIVGAGSAGSALVERLSEREDLSILLLEAGGEPTPFTQIPGEMPYVWSSVQNWGFLSTPQDNSCLGMINRQCAMHRGKCLGGTSLLNAIMYVRGNAEDYNLWARSGNAGWSYLDVLKVFKEQENSQVNGDKCYHGYGGSLNVEYDGPFSPLGQAFLDSNVILNRKIVDYNGEQQLGVGQTQFSTLNGQRWGADRAFLQYARKRNNLQIRDHAYVTKILFDEDVAREVIFSYNKRYYSATALQEIILSAGADQTAQILKLSGIGPQKELESKGISVIQDLCVGCNYINHPTFYGFVLTTNLTENQNLVETVAEYVNAYGPLTIAGNTLTVGFFQTKKDRNGVPDIELVLIGNPYESSYFQKALHLTKETYESMWGNLNPANTFSIYVALLHPKSVGNVTLASADPFDFPLINPNFNAVDEDLDTMVKGIRIAQEIIKQKPFKKLNAQVVLNAVPGCKKYKKDSTDFWKCQLKYLTAHFYHPMGTCKMGQNPKKGAVVNHELKVHGVKNLRVVDTSVIPTSLSAHLNPVAMMIGGKAADLILKKHSNGLCSLILWFRQIFHFK